VDKGNGGMKDIEEIQGEASLAFISFMPTFPVAQFLPVRLLKKVEKVFEGRISRN